MDKTDGMRTQTNPAETRISDTQRTSPRNDLEGQGRLESGRNMPGPSTPICGFATTGMYVGDRHGSLSRPCKSEGPNVGQEQTSLCQLAAVRFSHLADRGWASNKEGVCRAKSLRAGVSTVQVDRAAGGTRNPAAGESNENTRWGNGEGARRLKAASEKLAAGKELRDKRKCRMPPRWAKASDRQRDKSLMIIDRSSKKPLGC